MSCLKDVTLIVLLMLMSSEAQQNLTQLAIEYGIIYNGTCPNIRNPLPASLNPSDILGRWYLQYSRMNVLKQGKKCAFTDITSENGTVYYTDYDIDESTNQLRIGRGTVTVNFTESQFNFKFQTPGFRSASDYYVAGDFVNYAIVYNCYNCADYGVMNMGIQLYYYSRVREPSCLVNDQADKDLAKINLTLADIKQINQQDCPNL